MRKDKNNFAPRVGLAYSPGAGDGFRRTLLGENLSVIRLGFGVYYGAIIGDTALQQLTATGFGGTNAFFFPGGGTLADPFGPDAGQGTIPNPFQSTAGVTIGGPLSQFAQPIDPNIRTPYTYQYNATFERGFGRDFVTKFSYVGTRGLKLYAREQVNPAFGTLIAAPDGRQLPVVAGTGGQRGATPTNQNTRRLNDDIRLGLDQLVSAGNSYYNAFETEFTKRLSDDGLTFQVAYTFSKSITDADTQRGTLDLLDRRFGRGLSSQDVPHRLVVNGLYDLPFTRNLSGFAKSLLGGVTLGGIYTYQSGTPFSVGNPFDTTGTGGGVLSFADSGSETFGLLNPQENGNLAFNQNAFRAFGAPQRNAAGAVIGFTEIRRGTTGFNQFRAGNMINNFDLIAIKRTALPFINERTNLELRFEAFNAFNHTQFTNIDTNLNNFRPNDPARNTFGQYIATREARVIQLAARFNF